MSYYNTTNLSGADLQQALSVAKTQDAAVMAIYDQGGTWTPWGVHEYGIMAGRKWLIGSVRRSITNLEKAGALKQTGMQLMGPHGRPENIWSKA